MRDSRSLRLAVVIVGVTAALGCDRVSGLADFEVTQAGGGGVGGAGGAAAGSGGQRTGPQLLGDGVVARYFLDEAFGGAPETLLDAGPTGLDLDVRGTANLEYVEHLGQRGVEWLSLGMNGRGERQGVTDILHQTATATIEVKMALQGGPASESRVFHVGSSNGAGMLALVVSDAGLTLRLDGVDAATWAYLTTERHVAHVRIDLAAPVAEDRVVLFKDGVRSTAAMLQAPLPASLDVPPGTWFVLGNRLNGVSSPQGAMYYFALYGAALDDDQLANNAEELLRSDDG